MLHYPCYIQPFTQQRLNDLTNAMVPLQRRGSIERLPVIGEFHVRRIVLEHHGLLGFEIRIPDG